MDSNGFDRAQDALHQMHRNRPERRLAGVCVALAEQLDLPLPLVRAGFLMGALIPGVNGLVIALYLVLWFVTPPALGERSALDRAIAALRDLLGVDHAEARRRERFSSGELPTDPNA